MIRVTAVKLKKDAGKDHPSRFLLKIGRKSWHISRQEASYLRDRLGILLKLNFWRD